jgi:hypothetical protein
MYLWRTVDHEGKILDMLVSAPARQARSAAADAHGLELTRRFFCETREEAPQLSPELTPCPTPLRTQ